MKKKIEETVEVKTVKLNKYETSKKETVAMFKKVVCSSTKNMKWDLSPKEYLEKLITPSNSDGSLGTLREDISIDKLNKMTYPEKILAILDTGLLLSFIIYFLFNLIFV